MVMTMSKMVFSLYAAQIDSPSVLLSRINTEMRKLLLDNQYVTAFYLMYDHDTRRVKFTNAGHSRPLFYRKSKGKVMALDTDGLFVGIMDDTQYEEKSISIEPGDRIFFYTDGITEIKNDMREEFGEKRLARFMIDNASTPGSDFCNALLAEMNTFSADVSRNDDIAFLIVEF